MTRRGDVVTDVGVVLSGCVHMVMEDYWGNRNILSMADPGQMFGESFACVMDAKSQVGVLSVEASRVVFLDFRRMATTCTSACVFHERILRNLLSILARKNIAMTDKIDHVTKRTIREKILSYLSSVSLASGSSGFDIPFDRQQLADYLSVERTALSSGLSKLRDEGVITFRKNHFELL